MRGIRRTQAEAGIQPRTRLPITPQVLSVIYSYLPHSPDSSMIWAACCIGFFGFLRSEKFTVPSLEEYDPSVHLSLSDIALDSHTHPSILRIHLKQSKTDPMGMEVERGPLGCNGKTSTWSRYLHEKDSAPLSLPSRHLNPLPSPSWAIFRSSLPVHGWYPIVLLNALIAPQEVNIH